MDKGPHDKIHWRCCWKPGGGMLLWWASLLVFLGGLLALRQGGEFLSVSYQTWYWTALVGGVLASGLRARHGWCGCGACTGLGGAQGQ